MNDASVTFVAIGRVSQQRVSLQHLAVSQRSSSDHLWTYWGLLIAIMAKKKKKKSSKRREMQEEAKEELEVLAAIFGDQFTLSEDAHGFSLQVVPHPGRTEPNYVSVQISARCSC